MEVGEGANLGKLNLRKKLDKLNGFQEIKY
jgi:hypothetical protein